MTSDNIVNVEKYINGIPDDNFDNLTGLPAVKPFIEKIWPGKKENKDEMTAAMSGFCGGMAVVIWARSRGFDLGKFGSEWQTKSVEDYIKTIIYGKCRGNDDGGVDIRINGLCVQIKTVLQETPWKNLMVGQYQYNDDLTYYINGGNTVDSYILVYELEPYKRYEIHSFISAGKAGELKHSCNGSWRIFVNKMWPISEFESRYAESFKSYFDFKNKKNI